ncbi:MAG: PHP domain-containing protein [Candidatus Nanoarchaeia archaeon]
MTTQNIKYIDLHTHTMHSDGIEPPFLLAQNLKFSGADIVAKTDHDTLEGYEEFKEASEDLGLIVIPGIEFSEKDYHILGLGFNPYDKSFNELVKKSKYNQRLTNIQRVDALRSKGFPINMQKIDYHFPNSRLGKYNILRTLYQDLECRRFIEENFPNLSPNEVFNLTLKKNGLVGRVNHYNLESSEIINGIHNANGLAILAHPPKDVKNIKELDEIREMGIDGYEIQPNFFNKEFNAISYQDVLNYATKHDMLITYGSDFHGSCMPRSLLKRENNKLYPKLEERLDYWIHASEVCF